MVDKSHLTAIKRYQLSAPMELMQKNGWIKPRAMDWGCGHGFDAQELGIEFYDPYYSPEMPPGLFDTIICIYVLNVIPDPVVRDNITTQIAKKLKIGGCAYFAVRNDVKNLNGWTKRGTWQGYVQPRGQKIYECCGFRIYKAERIS